jgi:formamidopyrimidine-DNA glycosylase
MSEPDYVNILRMVQADGDAARELCADSEGLSPGPDPAQEPITVEFLKKQLENKSRSPIKWWLQRQENLAGFGDWTA